MFGLSCAVFVGVVVVARVLVLLVGAETIALPSKRRSTMSDLRWHAGPNEILTSAHRRVICTFLFAVYIDTASLTP